ncbi:MAG: DoxX family protein [Mucilaginibacter sp.]|nr:DoxX family protein [Mucilaginibacter sp.]
MQVLVFIGLIIAGGLLSLVIKPKAELVYNLAMGYVALTLLISVDVWIFYFSGIKNAAVVSTLSFIMSWGGMLGHLVLGFLVVNIAADNTPLRKIIGATLWGISILTANSFLVATVGKSMNIPIMISFFKQSGYAIWFLYFIMSAEAFGGLGILLHFKLKTGPLAAAGLAIIMLGAVYTHWHNKDPFSDSYAAVGQFINLSLLLILYYFKQQANRKLPATSIYVV